MKSKLYCSVIILSTFILLLLVCFTSADNERVGRTRHKKLNESRLKEVSEKMSLDKIREDLSHISVVRVPDTPTHTDVQRFLIKRLSDHWNIDLDEFTAETPLGMKKFTNIIATLKLDAEYIKERKRNKHLTPVIVIAAHYDSKYFKDFEFVGAIDSAVPCALMLNLADSLINKLSTNVGKRPVLKLVFFDGEEAFKEWTKTDSIYGARHLASVWSETTLTGGKTIIESIESFILLDLWGSSNPRFYSFFESTQWLYDKFVDIESRLRKNNLLKQPYSYFISSKSYVGGIEDDHIPFLEKGVPILHLIPVPFPPVWHKSTDDIAHVDWNSVSDLSILLKVFIFEYLNV